MLVNGLEPHPEDFEVSFRSGEGRDSLELPVFRYCTLSL